MLERLVQPLLDKLETMAMCLRVLQDTAFHILLMELFLSIGTGRLQSQTTSTQPIRMRSAPQHLVRWENMDTNLKVWLATYFREGKEGTLEKDYYVA